ncbi:hypothetical protein BC940DRAFT_362363 [Gongronella butleri]|nr:hypothetical protein BC940DRAFT_362363 [Gongronella butleri]
MMQSPYGDDDDVASQRSWSPEIKPRHRFSESEVQLLESSFGMSKTPDTRKVGDFAQLLGTTKKVIATWFQNRRAKEKKAMKNTRGKKGKKKKQTMLFSASQTPAAQSNTCSSGLMVSSSTSASTTPPAMEPLTALSPYDHLPMANIESHESIAAVPEPMLSYDAQAIDQWFNQLPSCCQRTMQLNLPCPFHNPCTI